jgi:hypothetical protein
MANPYTKLPGYVSAAKLYLGDDDDQLVVFDRDKIEAYSPNRARNRWRVRHMLTGKFRDYPTKLAAEIDASDCANSAMPHRQWWRD